jgi:hypothetical protein
MILNYSQASDLLSVSQYAAVMQGCCAGNTDGETKYKDISKDGVKSY